MVASFIGVIYQEKDGFKIEKPLKIEDTQNVIIPITRNSKEQRDYITLAEAQDVQIEDTGQIDYVQIRNNGDKSILVSRGEIFRGKTQERASVHGTIIMPHKSVRVAVKCIHRSKGINTGAKMKYGGRTPYDIDLSDQTSTWASVDRYARTLISDYGPRHIRRRWQLRDRERGLISSRVYQDHSLASTVSNSAIDEAICDIPIADDLVSTLENLSAMIKEALKRIPPIDNQVGAAFIRQNCLLGLDIYNLPASWEAVKEDIVSKEGSNFIDPNDQSDLFTFNPDKAKAFLAKELTKDWQEKVIFGETQGLPFKVIEVRSDTLIGEAVELNGKVINLTLFKK